MQLIMKPWLHKQSAEDNQFCSQNCMLFHHKGEINIHMSFRFDHLYSDHSDAYQLNSLAGKSPYYAIKMHHPGQQCKICTTAVLERLLLTEFYLMNYYIQLIVFCANLYNSHSRKTAVNWILFNELLYTAKSFGANLYNSRYCF